MRARRLLAGVAAALVLVVVPASPAFADPPKPTNYKSRVVGVDPPADGVRFDVVGGDAFLRVRASRGKTVTVLGYENEPYLRVRANGSVDENKRSPAVLLNTKRYSTTAAQRPEVDSKAEPDWVAIGGDGEHSWHDHRVHWMGKAAPPQLNGASTGRVGAWTVPVLIDGTPATVHGTLDKLAAPNSALWYVVALVAAVAIGFAARGVRAVPALATALAVAGVATAIVGIGGQLALPAAAGRRVSLEILPLIVLACGVGALVLRRTPSAAALIAGGALTLPLWILPNLGVLSHAVAPTSIDIHVQRAAVAVALATVAAIVVVGVVRQARSLLAPLDD